MLLFHRSRALPNRTRSDGANARTRVLSLVALVQVNFAKMCTTHFYAISCRMSSIQIATTHRVRESDFENNLHMFKEYFGRNSPLTFRILYSRG